MQPFDIVSKTTNEVFVVVDRLLTSQAGAKYLIASRKSGKMEWIYSQQLLDLYDYPIAKQMTLDRKTGKVSR